MGFSCSEESHEIDTSSDISNVKTFEDYLEFANADTDNRIMLQSLGAINNTSTIDVISARSKVQLGSIEFQIDEDQYVGENIFSGDEFITWNSNVDNLSQYYGKEVDVKVSNKLLQARNSSNSDDVVSFYIPEIISANLYNLKEGKIQPGSYITWNADPNNVNGIILAVEYKPTSQFTEEMVNEYNERLIKGLTIDDVGTYTITEEDLAEFPDNANLSFYIGRTGYVIETGDEGENDVYIGAYTSMRADMKIDKNND